MIPYPSLQVVKMVWRIYGRFRSGGQFHPVGKEEDCLTFERNLLYAMFWDDTQEERVREHVEYLNGAHPDLEFEARHS